MRKALLLLALLVSVPCLAFGDDEPPSLAAIAEANRSRDKKAGDRVLTNDDLKKAKGNVIFLQPTAAPAAPRRAEAPDGGAAPSGDLTRQLDESRGRALRLRAAVEAAQKDLADAPEGEARTALQQQLRTTLDELLKTHEAIGALTERIKPVGTGVPDPDPKN